jgi:post-segregation antitoxin (ccd killing protein)
MARLNVYLPDELAARAKEAGLNLSAVAQEAVRQRLAEQSTDAWLSDLPPPSSETVPHQRVIEALDWALDEASSRHG